MSATLCITRGLPGSGKTTWAKNQVTANRILNNAAVIRVNRDDLRRELYEERGQDYYAHEEFKAREANVTKVQHARIRALLEAGVNVVCDDTNLVLRRCRELMRIAEDTGSDFQYQDFPLTADECIARQANRPEDERVPEEVIRRMEARFMRGGLPPLPAESGLSSRGKTFDYSEVVPVKASRKYKQSAVIVDVDGTIARMTRRDPHDYAAVGTDAPIDDVIKVVRALHTVGYVVILLSGRKDSCREETMAWLDRYLVFYDKLLMRSAGDNRVDWKVKYELFNEHIRDEYYVVGAFDDRRQCLLLWEAMGITTFHVGGVDGGDF